MNKLMVKYPDRVPVIVESKVEKGKIHKYMVEKDKTVASFITQLRSRV